MFILFIIILLCSGISGMISERDQRQYEMYKKQREAKEKQEAKEKEFKEAQRIAIEKTKQEESKKAYEDDDYFLNDYDYYRAYHKDMYGITVGKFPGEASYEKCKANYDLINKIKTTKEAIDDAIEAKETLDYIKTKEAIVENARKTNSEINAKEESKTSENRYQKYDDLLEKVQEQIKTCEEMLEDIKRIESKRESIKEHLLQIEINITEKSNGVYKGTFKNTSIEYYFIWDGEHYPVCKSKYSNCEYRKMNNALGKRFEVLAEKIMLQCEPSCNLFEIKRKEENKRQEKINKISLEIEDLDI